MRLQTTPFREAFLLDQVEICWTRLRLIGLLVHNRPRPYLASQSNSFQKYERLSRPSGRYATLEIKTHDDDFLLDTSHKREAKDQTQTLGAPH